MAAPRSQGHPRQHCRRCRLRTLLPFTIIGALVVFFSLLLRVPTLLHPQPPSPLLPPTASLSQPPSSSIHLPHSHSVLLTPSHSPSFCCLFLCFSILPAFYFLSAATAITAAAVYTQHTFFFSDRRLPRPVPPLLLVSISSFTAFTTTITTVAIATAATAYSSSPPSFRIINVLASSFLIYVSVSSFILSNSPLSNTDTRDTPFWAC